MAEQHSEGWKYGEGGVTGEGEVEDETANRAQLKGENVSRGDEGVRKRL